MDVEEWMSADDNLEIRSYLISFHNQSTMDTKKRLSSIVLNIPGKRVSYIPKKLALSPFYRVQNKCKGLKIYRV